jgi:hypothetical protein
MDLQDISPTDLDQALTIDTSLSISPAPSPVDPIEIVTDAPGSPDSQSSAGPLTPSVDAFDGKLLESLLQGLRTNLSDFKPSEFPIPFGSEASINDAQNTPSFDPADLSCLTSPPFAAPPDQCMRLFLVCLPELTFNSLVSSWYQLNDLDIPSLEAPGVQTLPGPSLNLPISLSMQPDQQVAVAVAVCRADNLRPTLQVLIQSLAGALTQPSTSFPLTVPLTKVSS